MKKILVISNVGCLSPALRYRVINPVIALENKKKIKADLLMLYSTKTMKVLGSNRQLLKLIYVIFDIVKFFFRFIFVATKKYDVVIIKSNIFPLGGAVVEKTISYFIKCDKWIYDIDDAIYFNMTRKENKFFNLFRNMYSKVDFWVKKANKIIVSNEIIKQDLEVLYSLDMDKCTQYLSAPFLNQYYSKKDEIHKCINKELRIIWLGSPHTQKELRIAEKFVTDIPKYIRNVKIVLMGTDDDFQLFKNLRHVEFVKWSPEQESVEMRKAIIGLNPLFDDRFQQRKSAFKVIQYYRAGIMPIVSNVGINKKLTDKFGGYCTNDFTDIDDMCKFIFDYIKITTMPKHIYDGSMELSVEKNAEKLLNVIMS